MAPPSANREIRVREYRNAKEFERDAEKLIRGGWWIEQQSQGSTHMNVGRTLFTTLATGGVNMLIPKIGGASWTKGKITVTWARERPAALTRPQTAPASSASAWWVILGLVGLIVSVGVLGPGAVIIYIPLIVAVLIVRAATHKPKPSPSVTRPLPEAKTSDPAPALDLARSPHPQAGIVEQLSQLAALHEQGKLTGEEFQAAKQRLLA